MRVLVTGASGVIGRRLVKQLTERGTEVRALVNSNPESLDGSPAEVVRCDIRDRQAVIHAARGCDQIYHLAAAIHGPAVTRTALQEINVLGTENVAAATLAAGAQRLIYASSVAVYGRTFRQHGINEETPLRPDSPYGASKVASEAILRNSPGLPVVIVRFASVWGPGAGTWGELYQTIAAGRMRMIGTGEGLNTLMHSEDAARGMQLCAGPAAAEGRAYLLAGSQPVSLRELLTMIGDEVGTPLPAATLPALPLQIYRMLDRVVYSGSGRRLPKCDRIEFFLSDRTFDTQRARTELGFSPQTPPREIVRDVAEWFRLKGMLPGRKQN